MKLVFATNNQHKLEEIQAILGNSFELLSLKEIGCNEEIPEDHSTLDENARQKAFFIYEKYGYSCFADDTGLEVEALSGEPGVLSARYAGEAKDSQANMDKLITEKRGNTGFGYDPVFLPNSSQKTFAEMSLDEKNQISHRARAVKELTDYLKDLHE